MKLSTFVLSGIAAAALAVSAIALPTVAKEQTVTVGYVGLTADGKVVSEAVGGTAVGGGAARSMSEKPRAATINTQPNPAAFDFVRLPPGRYLVAARLQPGGPSAWAWVEVKAQTAFAALSPARTRSLS